MSEFDDNKSAGGDGAEEARQRAELDHLTAAAGQDEAISGEWEPGPDQFSESAHAQAKTNTADVLAPILMISFSLVAARKGSHWALTEPEATEAAAAYAEVIDKYFPDISGGPEVTAIIVTAMLVAPRLGEDKRQEVQKRKAAQEKQENKSRGGDGDLSE